MILGVTLLATGCATAPRKPAPGIVPPVNVKPSDKPPFTAFLDGVFPWRPSKTFSQTQRAFSRLCKHGELPDRDAAAEAVNLFDSSLSQPDLKPQEREALEKQLSNSREAFRFFDLVVKTQERFGAAATSSDPYVKEEGLKAYIQTYNTAVGGFSRPGYVDAIANHLLEVEPLLNSTAKKIRSLEREYSDSQVEAQNNFVQTAAHLDIKQARNHYHAGKGFWGDNEWEISKGLPLVQRVLESPRVHTSTRNEADGVKGMIWNELGRSERDRALSTRLPDYEQETNYPGNSETGKRDYVRKQWDRDKKGPLELTQK